MDGFAKKKYQPHAELAAVYGIAALGRVDYETICGLAFNTHRIGMLRADQIRLGVAMGFAAKLPTWWQEAVATSDHEAAMIRARAEAEQRAAEQMEGGQ